MRFPGPAVLSALLLSTFLATGCGDDDDESFGFVIAEWSIDEQVDPFDCVEIGADLFEVVFFDQNEVVAGEGEEPCESFRATFELPIGTYDVATRLITVRQEALSDTLFFEDVVVESDIGAVLHADFPVEAIR